MASDDRSFFFETLRKAAKRLLPERIPGFAADLYERMARQAMDDFYRKAAERIVSIIDSGSILDLGTGPGFLPIEIVGLSPHIEITGIDLTPEMIVKAKRNADLAGVAERLHFEVGDANRLRFDDGAFDGVISTGAFHAWKNPLRVLDECHRVLKPGGVGWIYDPARIGGKKGLMPGGRLKMRNWLAGQWGRWTGKVQTYSKDDLDRLLPQTGFRRYSIEHEDESAMITLFK